MHAPRFRHPDNKVQQTAGSLCVALVRKNLHKANGGGEADKGVEITRKDRVEGDCLDTV